MNRRPPYTMWADEHGAWALDDLGRDWTLTQSDRELILQFRGEHNRLRAALDLCSLRTTGAFVSQWAKVPLRVVNFMGNQLHLRPLVEPLEASSRRTTSSDHRRALRVHLEFCPYEDVEEGRLRELLYEMATRGDDQRTMVIIAANWLFEERIVRPGRVLLERLAGGIHTEAKVALFEFIASQVSEEVRAQIDEFLQGEERRPSRFAELRQSPGRASSKNICTLLENWMMLESISLGAIIVPEGAEGRLEELAEEARVYDSWDLRRMQASRRYSLVASYIVRARARLLDEVVQLHDSYITGMCRRARNVHQKRSREQRKKTGEALQTLLDSVHYSLVSSDMAGAWNEAIEQICGGREQALAMLAQCQRSRSTETDGYRDQLRARHRPMRHYFRHFLDLPFRAEPGAEGMLMGIELLREVDQGKRTALPLDVPVDFVQKGWRQSVVVNGRVDRSVWETSLAIGLRDALRSGDVYVEGAKHHASFADLLFREEQWLAEREEVYDQLGHPRNASDAIADLVKDFRGAARALEEGLNDNSFASIHQGGLKTAREQGMVIPAAASSLRDVISSNIPNVRLERVLVDVDTWCGFSLPLRSAPGPGRKNIGRNAVLAALVAHGTNLGVTTMAASTEGVEKGELERAARLAFRPATLKEANRLLVDFHASLPLSKAWGTGERSSSDGQRFGIASGSRLAAYYPRYFGYYNRAVSIYTHVSDLHSAFSSQVISCAPREALYVLDGLLDNDTILDNRIHHVDTHGATESLFGLCYLLGYELQPRMAALKDIRLYKPPTASFEAIDVLFHACADVALVQEQWDTLVRLAASLQRRITPAHVVVLRLTANKRSRLARSLVALGRLVKTTYLLRYLEDRDLRATVRRQLNRGESRHALAKSLFFGKQGVFRTGDLEQLTNKATALSILSNAILCWNTVHYQRIVEELAAHSPVDTSLMEYISPLAYAHVTPHGLYRFDLN